MKGTRVQITDGLFEGRTGEVVKVHPGTVSVKHASGKMMTVSKEYIREI